MRLEFFPKFRELTDAYRNAKVIAVTYSDRLAKAKPPRS